MPPRRRPLFVAITALFVIGALVALLYAIVGDPTNPFDNQRFDRESWSCATPDVRAGMSDDLVKHHLPPGMDESQVLALLGKPFDIEQGGTEAPQRIGTRHLMYDLGHWSMHGMDAAYVYVHLDDKGNVVGAEVYGY